MHLLVRETGVALARKLCRPQADVRIRNKQELLWAHVFATI